jgi:hypothetical protein
MLYIKKTESNIIITDSFVDYIPSSLDVYLDDTIVGTYNNESNDSNYLVLVIPAIDVQKFNNCEYKIKYVYYGETIKEELASIKDSSVLETKIIKTKEKTVQYYERKN